MGRSLSHCGDPHSFSLSRSVSFQEGGMESAGKDEPALAPEVQCRCSAGGVPAGVEVRAGGQNHADG